MIYQKLVDYCAANGLTIAALERNSGIANGTISAWNPENDKPSNPSLVSLQRLSRFTGIPIAELIGESS